MRSIAPIQCLIPLMLAAAFTLTACEYTEIDGIGTRTADPEHPPQSDIVSFDGCHRGELGQWRAVAEIVNNSPTTASYELRVAFSDGTTRLDERSVWVRNLRPEERAAVDHGWWVDQADRVTGCSVLTINRFG